MKKAKENSLLTSNSLLLPPQRSCVVCRVKNNKENLIRLVKSPDGKVFLDTAKKLPGRGVYICPDLDCLERAKKSGIISHSLKAEISNEFWLELEEYIKKSGSEKSVNLKIKSVLGLARKAGALLIGSERIENEIEKSGHKKILVILAENSSEGVKKFAASHEKILLDMTIKELSEVTGLRDSVQILALPLNSGFAKRIISLINKDTERSNAVER